MRNICSNELLALSGGTGTPEAAKGVTLLVQVADDSLVIIASLDKLFSVGNEGGTKLACRSSESGWLYVRLYLGTAKTNLCANGAGILVVFKVLNNDGYFVSHESIAFLLECRGSKSADKLQSLDDLLLSCIFSEVA